MMAMLSIPPPTPEKQNGKLGGYYDQGAVIAAKTVDTPRSSKE